MPKAAGSSLNRVCLCQSHGCGAMHFITKMGERKTGAEVNYRTQRSHRLQDRELEIRQASLARKEVSRKVDEEEEVSKSQRTAIVMQHIAGLTANPENEPAAETIASTSLNVELVGLDGGLTNQDLQNQENPGEIPGEVVHVLSTEVSVGGEPKVYDCGMHLPLLLLAKLNTDVEPLDRFYQLDWPKLQPSVLHSLLVASMMSIMEHSSLSTASWLLGTQRDSILLAARLGLSLTASNPRELDYTEEKVIRGIPKFITTAIKKLGIDPKLNKVVCCRKCFATYTPDKKIAFCTNTRFSEQEVQEGQEKVDEADIDPELIVANNMCGEPLLKEGPTGLKPIRYYAFQNLADWIGRMLSRNGMEEALDSSLKDSCAPFDPNVAVKDIHSSSAWKQFRGADGSQFTAKSGNLTFGLFVDGINPYGNKASGKKASITFLVLVCLTLPWQVRHLPKNLFLVGIAPGPREPKVDQINSILESMVEQFKELWEPGIWLTRTAAHPEGRRICAGLLAVFADLPALRRTLGFSSISHTLLCSFCYVKRRDIDNIDAASWPRRTAAEHALWSEKDKAAQTEKEREFILKNYGLRYSVLSELPYWNAIEGQTVDSMHNLLLGFLAWHCRQAWAMQDIRDTEDEPGDIPMREVLEVNADGARMLETALHPSLRPSQVHSVDQEDQGEEQQVSWLELPFGSESSENNEDFTSAQVLVEEDEGWDGTWTKPPTEKIIFDREMLAHINSILPRIHIPTWIKQPIRVLGQASNGKLKADEWRTLFTVQLVLILVPAWSLGPEEQSLLQNFGHLVALVNLALKRSMTSERIDAYEKHLSTYLEGTKELFEHLSLRPNHHMAFHLGECLRRFGPVRAWWCFVFERLMGRILKGSHNNHLGAHVHVPDLLPMNAKAGILTFGMLL